MLVWIEWLSGCANPLHTELLEQRREPSRNQDQALHPGMRSQLWWNCSQCPPKLFKHR